MLISNDIPSALIPVDLIDIKRDERQRREFTTEDLEFSLPRRGLIHPIVVRDKGDGRFELVAGERRLSAAKKIGWASIPCRFADGLSVLELELIELEENAKRKDLPWQDGVDAVKRLHERYVAIDPDWTQYQTAEAIGIEQPTISLYLDVAANAEAKPELLERKTVREAYNVIKRNESRKLGAALEELFESAKDALGPEEKEALEGQEEAAAKAKAAEVKREEIENTSFLDWAPQYAGPKFNLIHCDFPYGVELFAKEFGNRGGAKPYADSKDVYFALLECLTSNLDRIMSLSGHLVFWYSMKYDRETKDHFAAQAPSLEFTTHPFIWGKSDNNGIIGDARRDLRHTYEVALVARRGARQVVKSVADFYSAPTDRSLHPSTKPEPMLRHLFSALVDEHTLMLDPTCGSGSALRAADSLGASTVFGLEIDPEYCDGARVALRNARKLRIASATL